ncbi:MAG: hypothetical protein ACKPE1_24230, partial [Dolichospermum sp.]
LCYEVHHSHLPACGEGVGGGVILYLITSVSAVYIREFIRPIFFKKSSDILSVLCQFSVIS